MAKQKDTETKKHRRLLAARTTRAPLNVYPGELFREEFMKPFGLGADTWFGGDL